MNINFDEHHTENLGRNIVFSRELFRNKIYSSEHKMNGLEELVAKTLVSSAGLTQSLLEEIKVTTILDVRDDTGLNADMVYDTMKSLEEKKFGELEFCNIHSAYRFKLSKEGIYAYFSAKWLNKGVKE